MTMRPICAWRRRPRHRASATSISSIRHPICWSWGPLAWLPYLVSFLVFAGATLCVWLIVGTRVAGGGATATLCLLAVPSLWWVLGLGQNSFLSASLVGGGLLALPRHKVLAGLAFGLLCYKPHLGLLIPVAPGPPRGSGWRSPRPP